MALTGQHQRGLARCCLAIPARGLGEHRRNVENDSALAKTARQPACNAIHQDLGDCAGQKNTESVMIDKLTGNMRSCVNRSMVRSRTTSCWWNSPKLRGRRPPLYGEVSERSCNRWVKGTDSNGAPAANHAPPLPHRTSVPNLPKSA